MAKIQTTFFFTIACATALIGSASASAADGKPAADDAKQLFNEFAQPFLTGKWRYHTRLFNADGEVQFEGTDLRRYRMGVRGMYLIHEVYADEPGDDPTHIAIQLAGLDGQTGKVHLSQFWPWQAEKLGDAVAELTRQPDGSLKLTGTARPIGQAFPVQHFDCAMDGVEIFRCTSIAETEDGARYKSSDETATRGVEKSL